MYICMYNICVKKKENDFAEVSKNLKKLDTEK